LASVGISVLFMIAAVVSFDVGGIRSRFTGASASAPLALAVLPLVNLTQDASQEYFADGMTDELITKLAGVAALRVISRSSVMQYKGKNVPLRDIGRRSASE
jgi:TolB-like protein